MVLGLWHFGYCLILLSLEVLISSYKSSPLIKVSSMEKIKFTYLIDLELNLLLL